MSMQSLYEIAGLGQGWISERAQFAIQIQEQYAQGAITQAEQQELLLDLTRMDEINTNASELELKTALVTAIYAVAQVA